VLLSLLILLLQQRNDLSNHLPHIADDSAFQLLDRNAITRIDSSVNASHDLSVSGRVLTLNITFSGDDKVRASQRMALFAHEVQLLIGFPNRDDRPLRGLSLSSAIHNPCVDNVLMVLKSIPPELLSSAVIHPDASHERSRHA
jgi:hypothetical protein